MSDSQGQGQGRFRKGVWLSNAEGARSEKYQKWTDDHVKSTMVSLDKQKHTTLVKLNAKSLQVRTELRGLQQDRHQLARDRQGSSEGLDSLTVSSTADASGRPIRKISSSSNLTSASPEGVPSPASTPSSSSSPSFAKKSSVKEGGWGGGEAGGVRGKGVGGKVISPEVSAQKLKNIHSSRALSKLMNNMDLNN